MELEGSLPHSQEPSTCPYPMYQSKSLVPGLLFDRSVTRYVFTMRSC